MSTRSREPNGVGCRRTIRSADPKSGQGALRTPRLAAAATLAILGACMVWGSAQAQTRRTPDGPSRGSTLRIGDVSRLEGDGEVTIFHFPVVVSESPLDRAARGDRPITVWYRILDNSACCSGGDFQAVTGFVTIPGHVTVTDIPVIVYGDRDKEENESFQILVERVTNATIDDGIAVGTILNDDATGGSGGPKRTPAGTEAGGKYLPPDDPTSVPPPSISILDNVVTEGMDGTVPADFEVRISHATRVPVTLTYHLLDRSARFEDGDYQYAGGTITIPANRTSTRIPVTVYGDRTREDEEAFMVIVDQATNALLDTGPVIGIVTIHNDDFELAGGGGGPKRENPGTFAFALASSNPVRGVPSFRFSLPRESRVTLAIYDLAGRRIGTPIEGVFAAGSHEQAWTQPPPAPGVYLARIQSAEHTATQRISWVP